MDILTLNVGSSSIKLDRFDGAVTPPRRVAALRLAAGEPLPADLGTPAIVVHRVVHGGDVAQPLRVDAVVQARIEGFAPLAPLHNPPALAVIRACRQRFGNDLPQLAVFDTAFFSDLPPAAQAYALPRDLVRAHGIRRYGFHGVAHRALWRAWQANTGRGGRVITLQLGSGCSAAALRDGRPLDTSMGFTPLEGLVMATRSGDVDPGLLLHLQRVAGFDAARLERLLDTQSGLLGMAGSGDMRALLADGSPDAALAIDVYCHRVRKTIGAYAAVLGGLDGIVFGGGVDEHAAAIRRRVLAAMDWLGVRLDATANDAVTGPARRISAADSRVDTWVFEVDEAGELARAGQDWLSAAP